MGQVNSFDAVSEACSFICSLGGEEHGVVCFALGVWLWGLSLRGLEGVFDEVAK